MCIRDRIWSMLYDFQRDAVLAIINKLEKYNGCILADSVGDVYKRQGGDAGVRREKHGEDLTIVFRVFQPFFKIRRKTASAFFYVIPYVGLSLIHI